MTTTDPARRAVDTAALFAAATFGDELDRLTDRSETAEARVAELEARRPVLDREAVADALSRVVPELWMDRLGRATDAVMALCDEPAEDALAPLLAIAEDELPEISPGTRHLYDAGGRRAEFDSIVMLDDWIEATKADLAYALAIRSAMEAVERSADAEVETVARWLWGQVPVLPGSTDTRWEDLLEMGREACRLQARAVLGAVTDAAARAAIVDAARDGGAA